MRAKTKYLFRLIMLAGAAALPALSVLGKDFWIEKPFTEWNEREALAILTDSPWTRPSPIQGNYANSATPSIVDPNRGRSSGSMIGTGALGGANTVPLYVRWHSSLKVRQALARYTQIHGGITETQIQEFLSQPMPDYNIAISSPAMILFSNAIFETLQPRTFLTSKKNKSKKIPLKAYYSPKERSDDFAVFVFPREIDGRPSVDASDEEIIFQTQVGTAKLRAVFKLARMMVDGKLDN